MVLPNFNTTLYVINFTPVSRNEIAFPCILRISLGNWNPYRKTWFLLSLHLFSSACHAAVTYKWRGLQLCLAVLCRWIDCREQWYRACNPVCKVRLWSRCFFGSRRLNPLGQTHEHVECAGALGQKRGPRGSLGTKKSIVGVAKAARSIVTHCLSAQGRCIVVVARYGTKRGRVWKFAGSFVFTLLDWGSTIPLWPCLCFCKKLCLHLTE